ncbi:ornithine cyclodeaminase family protein [Legionella dresdenensis]|uniref:Ornithine cyclodeaminase family protein n=1 Tax=Legionella dresdenensis TaxID=450200 RepID=A0ABV8CB43_9GAMM
MSLKILSVEEVKQSITMAHAINAMERAFIQLANKQVVLPLRTSVAIEEENAVTLTMPAYLAREKALGLKVVSVFPDNIAKNKPAIAGFIMLLDATTGEPRALMDAGYLTALRTGAVSGLATKYFAPINASHVAIIGSGVQARTQLEAVAAVRPIEQVSVWSRTRENAVNFAHSIEHQYDVLICDTISEAVKSADIICSATNSTEPLIHLKELKPHAHINAIGSHSRAMMEIAPEVLERSVVIADQLQAALAESGEIIAAIEQNRLKPDAIIEFGNWLLHKKEDYKNKLTVFKSVGLAIQDIAVADEVYKNASRDKLGFDFSF